MNFLDGRFFLAAISKGIESLGWLDSLHEK